MTPTKDNTIIVGAIQESPAKNDRIFAIKRRETSPRPTVKQSNFRDRTAGDKPPPHGKTIEFSQSNGEQERHRLPQAFPRGEGGCDKGADG